MKTDKMTEAISGLDDDLIERHIKEKEMYRKRNATGKRLSFARWGSIAACLCLCAVIIGGAVFLPSMIKGGTPADNTTAETPTIYPDGTTVVTQDLKYDHSSISTGSDLLKESFNLTPYSWEDQTVVEKYPVITVNGEDYYRMRKTYISISLVGDRIGTFTARGTDYYSNTVHERDFDVYSIKDVSNTSRIAVLMQDRFYIYCIQERNEHINFGEFWDSLGLDKTVTLSTFGVYGENDRSAYGKETRKLNDNAGIWQLLSECRSGSRFRQSPERPNVLDGVPHITFTVTSEALGVYKVAFSVYENGFISTNIDQWNDIFFVQIDKTNTIIRYAMENSEITEPEPYQYLLFAKVTAIGDDYVTLDDTSLCRDEQSGRTYKIPISDLHSGFSLTSGHTALTVGDIAVVVFNSPIRINGNNTLVGVVGVRRGYIDGDNRIYIEESYYK